MSTSGGSSGGAGIIFAKQTLATPYGDPGVYALTSTDPVDGSWVDFSLDPTNGFLTVGAQTDDTFQASIGGGTAGANLSTYSDGAEVGSCNFYSNASYSKAQLRAETAQTEPVLDVRDSTGTTVFSVLQDGSGLLGAVAKMTDATPFGDPGLYASTSADPVDGAWVAVKLTEFRVLLTLGVGADDSFQVGVLSDGQTAQVVTYSDGAALGNAQLYSDTTTSKVEVRAEVGQVADVFGVRGSSNGRLIEVTGDDKIAVFAAPPVVQQTLSAADPILLADVITLAQDTRDLLAAYGWAALV